MYTFTLKVEQNGGEYYGYTQIKSNTGKFELKEDKTIIVDGVEITFDEHFDIISIK